MEKLTNYVTLLFDLALAALLVRVAFLSSLVHKTVTREAFLHKKGRDQADRKRTVRANLHARAGGHPSAATILKCRGPAKTPVT